MKKILGIAGLSFVLFGCSLGSTHNGYRLRNGSSGAVAYNETSLAVNTTIDLNQYPDLKLSDTQEFSLGAWAYYRGDGYQFINVKDKNVYTYELTPVLSKNLEYYLGTEKKVIEAGQSGSAVQLFSGVKNYEVKIVKAAEQAEYKPDENVIALFCEGKDYKKKTEETKTYKETIEGYSYSYKISLSVTVSDQ